VYVGWKRVTVAIMVHRVCRMEVTDSSNYGVSCWLDVTDTRSYGASSFLDRTDLLYQVWCIVCVGWD